MRSRSRRTRKNGTMSTTEFPKRWRPDHMTSRTHIHRVSFVLLASALAMVVSTGCAVGPKYQRPITEVPGTYRGAASTETTTASLADENWWEVFQDKQL